ncbi:MAG: hypothetical protein R3B70_02175 [Polyangiaceae bacterium]
MTALLARPRSLRLAHIAPAILVLCSACTEPQTPGGGAGTASEPTPSSAPTAPESTAAPTSDATSTPAGTSTAGTPSQPADTLNAPYVLTHRQTGGIAGMQMVTVIDAGARTITYGGPRNQKPETRPLSAEDIQNVTRALEDARYTSFPGAIKGPPVSDAFTYEIVLEAGGKKFTVSWSDGTTVPDPYARIQAAVGTLRTSMFSGSPPKGAPTM